MYCFVGNEKNFVVYTVGDWKPVKFKEKWCNVTANATTDNQRSCIILNRLKEFNRVSGKISKERIAIVKFRGDKCMYN